MKILHISGSPRKNSNTDYLLKSMIPYTKGEFIKLSNYNILPCKACWACQKSGKCIIDDEMSDILIPKLIYSDAIILGSPVFFNNVSAQLKAFIDRTWAIRGKLRNKIAGAVVVGRKYGLENAVTAINAFFLKHEMILANRGVCGIAFKEKEIMNDSEAINSAKKLAERIFELLNILNNKTEKNVP
ncbi:MAG: flavodoxin family protein [Candidatus Helarchaeota archaeon]